MREATLELHAMAACTVQIELVCSVKPELGRTRPEDIMLKSLGITLFFYASKYVNYAFNVFPLILVLC